MAWITELLNLYTPVTPHPLPPRKPNSYPVNPKRIIKRGKHAN